jgi:diguanylate cyclase (GGDEF)-like protein
MWPVASDAQTQTRLRTTMFASVDYILTVLFLLGYAAAGIISYDVPLKIFLVSMLANAIFVAGIGSGMSKQLRDPSLTWPQVFAACVVDLLGLLLAPQIAYLFILNLFVPLSYGNLFFSGRMFLLIWLSLIAALGAILTLFGGAIDIALVTPVERGLFWAFVAVTLARFLMVNAAASRVRVSLQDRNKVLAATTTKLVDLSSRDELTGLWNRREFMRLLQEESRRALRSGTSFCVAVIDIDRFKRINDNFGHLIGDAVLHELGQLLDGTRRATDSVARYGGEEFTLLLVQAKLSTATLALERTRDRVMQHDWPNLAPGLRLTISAGIADWQPGETLLQVLNRADAALSEAKSAGRNCVRVSSVGPDAFPESMK